ncbi:MBL fold metallo-hydrolase [uncultured Shewanella sp.]|uniref:MBL fold metallo-hydrolase n=1 Tax=uncultured Shewanella sp. TaxID=173975 RepID=UPI00261D6665|nr:MBL fold metallo-hydrolase [uncultured Shewanella sp.]
MNNKLSLLLLFSLWGCSSLPQASNNHDNTGMTLKKSPQHTSILMKAQWSHGAKDCTHHQQPTLDIYQHNANTFIMRQNKCLTYEAPFIYVLIGQDKILIIDTGDIEKHADISMYTQIKSAIGLTHQDKKWLVIHSHSHGDHVAGDHFFSAKKNVTLVGTKAQDIQNFFGFNDWPNDIVQLKLGQRTLSIIPTPGHQEEAITVYDPDTQWLLTGDSLYPGKIYIKDWQSYKKSILKLTDFSEQYPVKAILGAHIEMKNKAGQYYPIGTQYQPNESPLDLPLSDLHALNAVLNQHLHEKQGNDIKEHNESNNEITPLIFERFIIVPMNFFQRMMSNMARLFNS